MWRIIGRSVQGSAHRNADVGCQDFCAWHQVALAGESVWLIGIADGAGSARMGRIGAEQTVKNLLRLAEEFTGSLAEVTETVVKGWLQEVVREIEAGYARALGVPLREFACTVLFSLVADGTAVFFQIGDGAWIIETKGCRGAVILPAPGEYVNQTVFVTSADALDHLNFERVTGSLTAVAGITDGMQPLCLPAGVPHGPLLDRLFAALDLPAAEFSPLQQALGEFLDSPLINERVNDDKTLVLARWQPPAEPISELLPMAKPVPGAKFAEDATG